MNDIKHIPVSQSSLPTGRIILLRNVNTGAWRHLRVSLTATAADIKIILDKNKDTHRYIGDFKNWMESASCANDIEEEERKRRSVTYQYHNHQHVFED